MQSLTEEAHNQATSIDPLLACCLCRRLLVDAVQLLCLHNCCRQCFSSASSASNSQEVACGSCETVTKAGVQQPNGFIDSQVQRHKLVAESRICGKCQDNGERDEPAVLWCTACRHSLCEGCVPLHKQYFKQHVTQSLGEVKNLSEVLLHSSPSACPIHHMPLDIACRNCERARCIVCWADCNGKKHEMHVVGKDSFDSYIGEFVTCVSTMEKELLQKSEILEKPKSVLMHMKSARDRHLDDLKKRKRLVVDAVEMVYQEMEFSTKNAYDKLEAEGFSAAAAANRIASDLSDARNYVRRLVESNDKYAILKQQRIVRERLSILSVQLDTLNDRLATTIGEVKIETSLPDDVEKVIRAWIGTPMEFSASASSSLPPQQQLQHPQVQPEQLRRHPEQQQYLSFGRASTSVQLPVECTDVALTTDGHSLLLAAQQHGLIEICSSSGRELSRWRPPEQNNSDGDDDEVRAVTALSDGRAAVSLYHAKLVLLLRRRKPHESSHDGAVAAAAAGDVWTVDRRLCQLAYSPRSLSTHGDVLAVYVAHRKWLRLISTSSGQRLSADLRCEYTVGDLAVAAGAVVTGSSDNVQLGSGRYSQVLDAHSLSYGQRLWRHELNVGRSDRMEEQLQSLCADSTGGCVYAAVCRSDRSGRVSVLSLTDGSELRCVALRFDSAAGPRQHLLLPWRLSLSEDGAAATARQQNSRSRMTSSGRRRPLLLAVLHLDLNKQGRTVTVHRSICDEPL